MSEYKELKTSFRQRLVIIIVTVVLLASTVAIYIGIVMNYSGNGNSVADNSMDEVLAELEKKATELEAELAVKTSPMSDQYFDEMSGYRANVKAYNAAAVKELDVIELSEGEGEELVEGSTEYFAYYIGWCPDESIFDSSFDSSTEPTSLKSPLRGGDMIDGWKQGIIGMKPGGVREITMPGELAYGESREICGAKNSPLKFIVKILPYDSEIGEILDRVSGVNDEIMNVYYGAYQ